MSRYYYQGTTQIIEKGDRVRTPDGEVGEIVDLYAERDGLGGYVPKASVLPDGNVGVAWSGPLDQLTYLAPEAELAERIEQAEQDQAKAFVATNKDAAAYRARNTRYEALALAVPFADRNQYDLLPELFKTAERIAAWLDPEAPTEATGPTSWPTWPGTHRAIQLGDRFLQDELLEDQTVESLHYGRYGWALRSTENVVHAIGRLTYIDPEAPAGAEGKTGA
jgi:hypothetical protein